jgi:hypothetical protein
MISHTTPWLILVFHHLHKNPWPILAFRHTKLLLATKTLRQPKDFGS